MTLPTTKQVILPVLLIEDEPAVAEYVRTALERNGYAVVCSKSGADGVRLLGSGEYLGVVSDMHMRGGLNGAQVHAWVAQHRPDLACRFVFTTGDIANDDNCYAAQNWRALRREALPHPATNLGCRKNYGQGSLGVHSRRKRCLI
jgi:CheY-like chemotaxis protein